MGDWIVWMIATVNALLAATSICLVAWAIATLRRLTDEQVKQWSEIGRVRDGLNECETRDDANRRLAQVWTGIDTIRNAVSELSTLSAGQFVRRDEFRGELKGLKDDLMAANRQEIELLKQLIRKTG